MLRRKQREDGSDHVVKQLIVGFIVKHGLSVLNDHADRVQRVGNEVLVGALKVVSQIVQKIAPDVYASTHDYRRHYTFNSLPNYW